MSGRSRTLRIEILGDAKQAVAAFDDVATGADGLGSKLGGVAKVGGAALLGLGTVAAGLGVVAYKMGGDFDEAFDAIAIGTGATGDALADLEEDFKQVVADVPTDFDTAAGAIAGLNTLTGATGETLQELTGTVLNASRMLGEDGVANAEAFGRAMTQWNTPAEDGAELMDDLFKVTQDYGIGLGELIGQLNTYGPVMKNAGFSTEETAELMARLHAEGISWSRISPGLNASFRKWAEAGKDPREELERTIEAMQNVETEAEALTLATDTFGAEGAQRLTTAVRNGSFAIDDLGAAMGDNAGLVNDLAGETDDLSQKFTLLKNRTLVALEPITSGVFNLAGTLMDKLLPATETVLPAIVSGIEGIANAFREGGISGALAEIGSKIQTAFGAIDWGSISGTIGSMFLDSIQRSINLTAGLATWLWDAFKGINFKGIGETLVSGLLGAVQAVGSFAGDVAGWLVDTFTGISWTDTGKSIVDGILSGISAVADAGSRVLGWLSGQLSSVEWLELGTTVVNGLMDGVMAVVDAGERVLGWLSGQLSAVDWSGLGTTIIDGLMAGVTAVTDFGQRFIDWFRGGIEGGDWAGIGESISGQISGAMEGLSNLGPVQSLIDLFNTHLLPVLQLVGDEVGSRVTPMIDGFRESIGQAASNISANLGPTLESLTGLWQSLQPAIGAVLPVLQVIAMVVGGVLLAEFNGLVGILSGVLPNAVNAAFAVLNGLIQIITGVVEVITGLVRVVKGLLTGDWALAWDGAKQVVSGMVTAITGLFSGLWGAIKGFVMAVVDGVIGLFKGLYHTLVGGSIIPDMINDIITWFLKLPGEVVGIISGFIGSAIGFFGDLAIEGVAKAGELIGGVLGEVGRLMVEGVEKVSGFVHSALGFLGDLVTEGATKAGEFLTGVLDALLDLFIDGPKRIWDFVKAGIEEIAKLAVRGAEEAGKLPGEVLTAIGDLSTHLLQSGKDLVQGMIDGITGMLGDLAGAAGSVVSTITDNIKNPLGIFSPSRVMHAYGVNIAEGLIEGMESKLGDIFDAASELSNAILTGATRDLNRVPELVGSMTDDVALTLANTREDLLGQLDLAILRGDDEETLQGYRDQLAAIDALLAVWAEATGQTVQGVLEQVAADVAAAALPSPEDIVAEWDQRLADALSGPAFGENLQASIDELDSKISFGKLMGAPQHVIDAWEEQKADLKKQAGFYWYDVAQAAAAGLIDPKLLKEYAKAGGEQFAMYLDSIVGPAARKEMLGGVQKMGKESVAELKEIFSEAPEIAEQFIDDIVQGMKDGSIDVKDGMALLAMIPREELIPTLEEMSELYQKQIIQAMLDGNYELAESLRLTKAEVDALASSMDDGATSASKYVEAVKEAEPWKSPMTGQGHGSGGSGGGSAGGGGVGTYEPGEAPPPPPWDPHPPARADTQKATGHLRDNPALQEALRKSNPEAWARFIAEEQRLAKAGPAGRPSEGSGQTIQNNITLNVDGEPMATAVNTVNTRNLTSMLGPEVQG